MRKELALILFVILLAEVTFAISMQLPVQGKLKGQTAGDVNKQLPMTFSIYSVASGGSAIWSQTKNVDVNIIDEDNNIGVFSTLIGDTVLLDFNSHFDMNYLGITIQNNSELSPRVRIGTAAYAQVARRLAVVEDLNLGVFGVKAFGDSNFNRVYANFLFGNGAGLTDVLASTNWADINAHVYGILDVNKWFHSLADLNLFYYKMTDVNAHFQGRVDLNANFYGKLDVNTHFVPYIGATRDVNLNYHDLNARSISAVAFFGSGAGLTDLPSGSSLPDSTLDNNALAQAKFWALLNANVPWADANVANDITLDNLTQVTTRNYSDLQNKPYIPTESDIDLNAIAWDTNAQTACDGNSVSTGLGNCVDINGFYLSGGTDGFTATLDVNAAEREYLFGLDLNAGFQRTADVNNFFVQVQNYTGSTVTMDVNALERTYLFGLDWNSTLERIADINAFFYRKTDVNAHFVPFVGAARDINLNYHDLNARSISAVAFFDASGKLTSSAADGFTNTLDVNAAERQYLFGLDWNSSLERIADLNAFFYRKTDVNAHFYGKVDANAHLVGFIRADNVVDMNLSAGGLTAWDGNFYTLKADKLFGDASGVTGVLTLADGNAHYVPYIGATRDVNLGLNEIIMGETEIYEHNDGGFRSLVFDVADHNVMIARGHREWVEFLVDVNILDDAYIVDNVFANDANIAMDSNLFSVSAHKLFVGGVEITGNDSLPADMNQAYYSQLDANRVLESKVDLNANFYGKQDVNREFVPYVGATRDVNLATKAIIAGKDSNIGGEHFWQLGEKDMGEGLMYPLLKPWGDGGNFGAIEGGLSLTEPYGIDLVTIGLYDYAVSAGWHFQYTISTGALNLGKSTITAPFYIESKTVVTEDFNVTRDVNVGEDVNVTGSVKATAFFGSGAGLTGVMSQTDANNHYVGFVRTGNTVDVNLAQAGITAWDGNYHTLKADYLFGDASGVTGVLTLNDGNAHYVPYVGADYDTNLGSNGITSWDGNYRTLEADYLFGDGSGITGLAEAADVNSHFVPYIGADYDVNLNNHDLNARYFGSDRYGFHNKHNSGIYASSEVTVGYQTMVFWLGTNIGGANAALVVEGGYNYGNFYLHGFPDVNMDLGLDTTPFGRLWLAEDANLARAIKVNGAVFGNTSVKIGDDLNLLTKKIVSDVNISSGTNKGVSIDADINRICFPANSCEMMLDYNGTAFIFGS